MISPFVLNEFLSIPERTTDESEWNGAWNMLLNAYFPMAEGWVVKPRVRKSYPPSSKEMFIVRRHQARPPEQTRDAVDFCVIFQIERNKTPVMFVELKPLAKLRRICESASFRAESERRFADFYDASPTVFTGISAFGPVVCKYELNKEDKSFTPELIPDIGAYINDVAPLDRWDLDLRTDVGGDRILDIFEKVKMGDCP